MYGRKVREFTEACNDDLPNKPREMNRQEVDFIIKMVNDEMKELQQATDVVGQADALVDAIYYLFDAAARNGVNLDPLFEIVHSANMKKVVNGKVLRREDGKILKPEGWEPPEPLLEREVERQRQEGAF